MTILAGRQDTSITVSLFEQNLAQAIDELCRCVEFKKIEQHDDFIILWRFASSSILHGFCAIDSLVNLLEYEHFENKESTHYIEAENRKCSLKQLKAWRSSPFWERLKILMDEDDSEPIPKQLKTRIQELNELRNWIAHGIPYTVIFQHEFIQVDEDTVRGVIHGENEEFKKQKFRYTKFHSPAKLDETDAQTALLIILEVIIFILKQTRWPHYTIKTYHGMAKEYSLDSNSTVDSVMTYFELIPGHIG
jgi:hypothetical protein